MLHSRIAAGHAIVPDGVASEWVSREPAASDSARIVHDRDEPAEFVWRDRAGDARASDDLTQMRVHGNPDGLGFFFRFASAPSSCAQVQIAMDFDRAPTSGAPTFSSDPATRLRNDSRAELFVIATAAGGVVRNAAGVELARFGAGVGADGLELFVPWVAMGMARWPTGMRFTPAVFCAPDRVTPIAPSDGITSAVIDALTDYGGPSLATRSTPDEVSDGVLDHVFATHFGISGTIRDGVQIRRLAPTATTARGGPWIELMNICDESLSLNRFAIGDEAIPGGPDGLSQLPDGLSLAPGARLTIAVDGAAYRSTFGVPADVELAGTDPSTPDATPLAARARGAIVFDPAGDEVAVFDEERTLLDVVNYNAGAYPMIRAFSPLAANTVISRSATGLDIDDNALDFFNAGAVCGAASDCPDSQCNTCSDRVCVERPDGLSCSIDGCPIGRCFVGACTRRPDAGTCASDAAIDSAASTDGAALADAVVDTTSSDAASVSDSATMIDGAIGDGSASLDVIADDGSSDASLDAVRDAGIDGDRRDAGLDADAQDAGSAAVTDAATSDDRATTPRPGCSCRAAATAPSTLWHAVAIALGCAAISRRKRRWRRN